MLMTNPTTRCWNLVNATRPPQQTVPLWLYPCLCSKKPCKCLARLCLDVLLLQNYKTYDLPPTLSIDKARIILIEFAFCHDREPITAITRKKLKYDPLIQALTDYGWIAPSLLVITAGYQGGRPPTQPYCHKINGCFYIR